MQLPTVPPRATRERDLITLGEAMVLLLAEPGVPVTEASSFRRLVAGSESNVAIALARLGYRVGFAGRVGADAFGTVVRRAIRGEGVDTSRLRGDDGAPTGVLVRDARPGHATEVLYLRAGSAGSRLAPGDVDDDYVASARILHVTGITPALSTTAADATYRAADAARGAGMVVTLDPNVRRRLGPLEQTLGRIRPLIRRADVVLAGRDEAIALTGTPDAEAAAHRLLGAGPRLVVIKDGANGSTAYDGTDVLPVPAASAVLVDPVGAGDAYAAGFIDGLLRGTDVAAALHGGTALGALAVGAAGDVEGLPHGPIPVPDGPATAGAAAGTDPPKDIGPLKDNDPLKDIDVRR
ncbi:MAG: sugar kinase [Mycobacteriales bacterium]